MTDEQILKHMEQIVAPIKDAQQEIAETLDLSNTRLQYLEIAYKSLIDQFGALDKRDSGFEKRQQSIEKGQHTLADGQLSLISGQKALEGGQQALEDRQQALEKGQQAMEDRQQTLEKGQQAQTIILQKISNKLNKTARIVDVMLRQFDRRIINNEKTIDQIKSTIGLS